MRKNCQLRYHERTPLKYSDLGSLFVLFGIVIALMVYSVFTSTETPPQNNKAVFGHCVNAAGKKAPPTETQVKQCAVYAGLVTTGVPK